MAAVIIIIIPASPIPIRNKAPHLGSKRAGRDKESDSQSIIIPVGGVSCSWVRVELFVAKRAFPDNCSSRCEREHHEHNEATISFQVAGAN